MYRDHTKVVQIGDRKIGGGNPILIQSMTNTRTEDVEATVAQIQALAAAGCAGCNAALPAQFSGFVLASLVHGDKVLFIRHAHHLSKIKIQAHRLFTAFRGLRHRRMRRATPAAPGGGKEVRNAKNLRPAMRPRGPGYGVRDMVRLAGLEPAREVRR